MGWKSHLVMYFGCGGEMSVSEIVSKVESMGFSSSLGPVDFVKDWDKEPTKEEIFELMNSLQKELKGTGVIFNLDTHD